jgi:hypothetical protein
LSGISSKEARLASVKPYAEIGGSAVENAPHSIYIFSMPNRKTFDEREKYDHSSHPLGERQPSDLKADIQDKDDKVVKVTPADRGESSSGAIPKPRTKIATSKRG